MINDLNMTYTWRFQLDEYIIWWLNNCDDMTYYPLKIKVKNECNSNWDNFYAFA